MAYQRHNFKDGETLLAEYLNKMEDALCDMPCVNTAEAGQVLAVAEVDETGKPKRYEAVNMEGGGGGVTSWNDLEDRPFYSEGNKFEPIVYPDSFYNTETEEWYNEPIDLGAIFGEDSMLFYRGNVQVSDVENYIEPTFKYHSADGESYRYDTIFYHIEDMELPEGTEAFEVAVYFNRVDNDGGIESDVHFKFLMGVVSRENEYGLPIGVYISFLTPIPQGDKFVITNENIVSIDEKYLPFSIDEIRQKAVLAKEQAEFAQSNLSTAKNAEQKADEAFSKASTAYTMANSADNKATTAKAAAESAKNTANNASAKATELEERLENGELGGKEPLVGTYAEITPTEVSEAIAQGRPVTVMYVDSTYGVIVFTGFGLFQSFNVVLSSNIVVYYNQYINVELIGNINSDTWSLLGEPMAKVSDIPEIPDSLPNPNALTFTGAVSGTYDGSSAKTINIPTIAGEKGEDGVSIASVTQTTTSTADGGENVVTVTLSNGTKSTFKIKNGTKGSNGADGKDADGIIPDYVKEEAERVAAVVQSRQNENTISFFACSDLHYSQIQSHAPQQLAAMTHMGQGMKLIREKVKIDFAAMLGDMIWDVGETQETGLEEIRFVNECLSEGFGNLPQIRSRGNHEDGYESGADFSKSQIFANIGIFNKGAVYDDTNRIAGYCYRDFEDSKLRVICLNSSEEGGCLFSSAQVSWLASALDLSEKGKGWRSIILSHHPIDWGKSGGVDPTSTIKNAKGLIGTFHGHIHNFLVGTLTGTELKRIAIPNAGHTRENQYGTSYNINWKEDTTYSKTPGTATDTSFCIVTIDFKESKIYIDHYGAGYDREVTYIDTAGKAYTNLVPTSIDPSTGGVYNTVGYKDGKYASGANEGSDAAYVLTGLIPYGNGVTTPIYIKGADVTAESHCRIISFDAAKGASFQSAAGSALATYFTVETLGTSYYKLTPTSSWTSATGNKDYLRFSLKGTGANLIITLNEPIE